MRGPLGPRTAAARDAAQSLPAPRGLTRRAAALAVLLLVVAAALAPYLHASISQRADLSAAREQLAAGEQEVDDLEVDLDRWDDPAYVQQQARERLNYVMPGDTPYIVTGESAAETAEEDPSGAAAADVVELGDDRPWFGALWDSVQTAGEGPR